MDMNNEQTLAALVATVDALKDEVHALRSEIRDRNKEYVSQAEFTAWRTGLDREVATMKAARAPWWQVAGGVGSLVAIGVGFIALVNAV